MPRIKVLHYLNQVDIGGTVKTALLFAKHLSRGEFDVRFAFKAGILNGMPISHIERLREFEEAVGREKVSPIQEGDFQAAIDDLQPDILHLYRAGLPEYPQPGKDFMPNGMKVVETNVFGHIDANQHIDKTLFMSEWLMHNAMPYVRTLKLPKPDAFLGTRFDFVNNPVESPHAEPHLDLNVPKNNDIITLTRVGRPDNGIYDDISVKAAKLLKDRGYKIVFVTVAAPPNMTKDLQEYGIDHVPIDPTSNSQVLSSVYELTDIYCHARADGETFGVNIAEAMIHGKPVVTHVAVPKVPGMGVFQSQTTLVDHGETGFVVNPYDVEEYAKYLELLINNPSLRDEMGRKGHKKASQEYFVYPVVKKLENIYRALCQKEA